MKLGLPSIVVVTERFEVLGRAVAESREVPNFPLVVLPSNVEQMDGTELISLGQRTLDEALQTLIRLDEGADSDAR